MCVNLVDMENQLALPNPEDWCTVGWAADKIGVSKRTVQRLMEAGALNTFYPRRGRFDRAPDPLLCVAEVERYVAARLVLAGRG